MTALTAFLAAVSVAFVLGYPIYWGLARWKLMDQPNERSSHAEPVVRGGGLAMVLTMLILGLMLACRAGEYQRTFLALLTGGLLIAGISFLDDRKPQPFWLRLAAHCAAAAAALSAFGWPAVTLGLPGVGTVAIPLGLSSLILLLWLVGYTNAFNFMDGINGLAASQAWITAIGTAIIAGLAAKDWASLPVIFSCVVAGTAAGFLPHNFPQPRMFMGDVGSATLGYLLAVLVIWIAELYGWWLLIPLALLHANFVLDTGITLIRRLARRERWFEAHREHFYQRLIRSGQSHYQVTVTEMAAQVTVLLLSVAYLTAAVPGKLGIIGAVLLLWLAYFGYAEMSFRRTLRGSERVLRPSARS